MGKNVAVFVDVANIFYAAKAAGVDIDYVTLLKSATAGRDLVRAYAYTGLDPDNENQRNFHDFLRRSNYKVVSKDIRKYGDGKVKANLDIELVVDMMKTARNLDIAIVVSGDGDFAPAIRAVQEMGVRCEVISFRGNTSSDLIEVADLFTDIIQLARVEKGSRSGRRVARRRRGPVDDRGPRQADRGHRRRSWPWPRPWPRSARRAGARRGVGRGRGRAPARTRRSPRQRPATATAASSPCPASGCRASGRPDRGRPGRRRGLHARRRGRGGDVERPAEVDRPDRDGDGDGEDAPAPPPRAVAVVVVAAAVVATGECRGRRARRAAPATPGRSSARRSADADDEELDEDEIAGGPAGPRSTPFGSVWDSQLGTPARAGVGGSFSADRRRRGLRRARDPRVPDRRAAARQRPVAVGGGGGGARGGRAAYQSAIARERYGRGGGGGGINRYPGRQRPHPGSRGAPGPLVRPRAAAGGGVTAERQPGSGARVAAPTSGARSRPSSRRSCVAQLASRRRPTPRPARPVTDRRGRVADAGRRGQAEAAPPASRPRAKATADRRPTATDADATAAEAEGRPASRPPTEGRRRRAEAAPTRDRGRRSRSGRRRASRRRPSRGRGDADAAAADGAEAKPKPRRPRARRADRAPA